MNSLADMVISVSCLTRLAADAVAPPLLGQRPGVLDVEVNAGGTGQWVVVGGRGEMYLHAVPRGERVLGTIFITVAREPERLVVLDRALHVLRREDRGKMPQPRSHGRQHAIGSH